MITLRLGGLAALLLLGLSMLAGCHETTIYEASCTDGAMGCPCFADGACDDDLSCQAGRCALPPDACPAGQRGCACADGDRCAAGLSCESSSGRRTCGSVCAEGDEGCPCRGGAICDAAADGSPLECREAACQRPRCELGTLDCLCAPGGGCPMGAVCDDGRCRTDTGQPLEPPVDPQCYTPCRGGGLDAVDGYRACSAEGLLPGCIGGNVCLSGTCIKPPPGGGRVELPTCSTDYHCPDFQTCIEGRCYSDCGAVDGADECRGARVCHRKVCRLPCALNGDPCPSDQWCDTREGALGYCAASASARAGGGQAAEGDAVPPATVTVEPDGYTFRLGQEGGEGKTLTLQHGADYAVTVTIRPLSHTVYLADDSELVHANEAVDLVPRRPLCWISLAADGVEPAADGALSIAVPPGDGVTLDVISDPTGGGCFGVAGDVGRLSAAEADEWFGTLEVTTGDSTSLISLKSVRADGRWAGRISFYGNFGAGNVDAWLDALRSGDLATAAAEVRAVENALIRRWWAFRTGVLPFEEFAATIDATEAESWRTPLMTAQCPAPAACYPISNPDGYSVYTDDTDTSPIPTGLSELSIAMNLQAEGPEAPDEPVAWVGRIDSSSTLQYPGNPPVRIEFAGDPLDCFGSDAGGICPLTLLESTSVIGGRYRPDAGAGCAAEAGGLAFDEVERPWFQRAFGDAIEALDGSLSRTECRGAAVGAGEDAVTLPTGVPADDLSLTAANPLDDGRPLVRRLELLDGALFNGDQIFVLFREALPELFPGAGASFGYGYMWLTRSDGRIDAEDYVATAVPDAVIAAAEAEAPAPANTACSAALLEAVDDDRVALAEYAVSGLAPGSAVEVVPDDEVHWFCADTGKLDGPCPVSSAVTFFAVREDADTDEPPGDVSLWECNRTSGTCLAAEPCAQGSPIPCEDADLDASLGDLPAACFTAGAEPCAVGAQCASKGTCQTVLDAWSIELPEGVIVGANDDEIAAGVMGQYLVWRCTDDTAWCSEDRADLRAGKTFYAPIDADVDVLPGADPLQELVDTGFSYRTRFRSRLDGGAVGFAPRECEGATTPYCYDAPQIGAAAERLDCLSELYVIEARVLPDLGMLADLLRQAFSFDEAFEGGRSLPTLYYGFEFLFAELLVTLGDDAYAESFVTRFDLAGLLVASFPGDRLEPDGIELSGAAGYELLALYLAVQSYQVAIDRFIGLRDVIGATLDASAPHEVLIDAAAATSWFQKILRASAQKARASARIAERYLRLDEAGLARHVVRRAYATAWLESIYFSQLMKRLLDRATAAQKAQVQQEIETAQLVYKDALLQMRDLNDTITDDETIFGFARDYVPIPPLDPGGTNAFEVLHERAREKAAVAFDKEVVALADRRDFETDEAEFLSTLTELQLDADGALAEICGFIEVPDADGTISVYPATSDYAYLSPDIRIRELGDPCGLVGNGSLYTAYLALADAEGDLSSWELEYAHILERIADEQEKLSEQCERIIDFKDWRTGVGTAALTLNTVVQVSEEVLGAIDSTSAQLQAAVESIDCIVGLATDCVGKAAATAAQTGIEVAGMSIEIPTKVVKSTAELALVSISEIVIPERELQEECEALTIDSKFAVRDLFRDLQAHAAGGTAQLRAVDAAVGEIQHLQNMATCVQATATEQRQLTVDVESARNDPNVRIYRNSAIIDAERTFDGAVAAAWRATRGFEYYTNQSYAARDGLLLVRMVGHGDVTLEAYLDELEDAYHDFEEVYGNPDLRVETISLQAQTVGALSGDSLPLAGEDCAERFRAFLQDPQLRDADGFVTVPFRTSLADPSTFPESGPVVSQVSPLTHNHKIRFIEVELVGPEGEDHGDALARVYVRQGADGVGELRQPGGDVTRYVFPQRTAVVNVWFNGERPLEEALGLFEGSTASPYRNERLRDRPLHHTDWTLVLHPTDEPVNRDFDLTNWVTDIKIHLWYSDFTEL